MLSCALTFCIVFTSGGLREAMTSAVKCTSSHHSVIGVGLDGEKNMSNFLPHTLCSKEQHIFSPQTGLSATQIKLYYSNFYKSEFVSLFGLKSLPSLAHSVYSA